MGHARHLPKLSNLRISSLLFRGCHPPVLPVTQILCWILIENIPCRSVLWQAVGNVEPCWHKYARHNLPNSNIIHPTFFRFALVALPVLKRSCCAQ
jgi:hypothetical protein